MLGFVPLWLLADDPSAQPFIMAQQNAIEVLQTQLGSVLNLCCWAVWSGHWAQRSFLEPLVDRLMGMIYY